MHEPPNQPTAPNNPFPTLRSLVKAQQARQGPCAPPPGVLPSVLGSAVSTCSPAKSPALQGNADRGFLAIAAPLGPKQLGPGWTSP